MNANILKLGIIGVSFIFMFAMRFLPFKILGKSANSEEFDRFIKYIPLGVFVAMIIKDIFFKNGQLFLYFKHKANTPYTDNPNFC